MRVYNFAAGPAMLPTPVLERAREELLDWRGSGMSVMEISHRSRPFVEVAETAEADLRDLLAIPPGYQVLFLQGGATQQFATIPLNLAPPGATADYVNTGIWSTKAIQEARRHGPVHVVADGADSGYCALPPESAWQRTPGAAYLHYTVNETIAGLEFPYVPASDVPLVADMSSTILSRPLDVSRFGLIYAGAQKNIGPSGLTLVIVRDELIGHARAGIPTLLDYRVVAAEKSMLNTPPTFAWYLAGLVFKWLKAEGGLTVLEARNRAKASALYSYIDGSGWYQNPIAKDARSWMNVTFRLPDAALEPVFLKAATAAGLTNLEGHRSVGGLRASIYNAMPLTGVLALISFMRDFAARHG
jgi:phosphoserine aminotransferase